MKIIDLYKYIGEYETVVTPNKRSETDEPSLFRLVADEGKVLTNGETETECIDTYDVESWTEADSETEETEGAEAL